MARHIIDHGGNMKISKLLSSLVSIALFVSIAGCQNVDKKQRRQILMRLWNRNLSIQSKVII